MSDDDEHVTWVPVASFGDGLSADLARQALEAADIPVLVRSDRAGLFGATFQGGVPGGVDLLVPSPEVERARELLGDDEEPGGGTGPTDFTER